MSTLVRAVVTRFAGYEAITWDHIRPSLNLLVGRNGSGKSTLLEAIVVGLNFIHGKRTGDLLTGTREDAEVSLFFADGAAHRHSMGEMRSAQTAPGSRRVENILYLHESRRPKSRVGRGRSELTQHPSNRYDSVLSEMQALMHGTAAEQRLAARVIDAVRQFRHGGYPQEWAWMERILAEAGPNARRPVSSGQYDLLALVLDVLRTEEAVHRDNLQPFVIIDNPEVYLHPALQAEVLDWLSQRLPRAQIILTTHSVKL